LFRDPQDDEVDHQRRAEDVRFEHHRFGSYHYKGKKRREGDWMLTGFSPRKPMGRI